MATASEAWTKPPISKREEFLSQMVALASRVSIQETTEVVEEISDDNFSKDEQNLIRLINQKDYSEAFFIARRLVAEGEDWALEYLNEARLGLN